MTAPNHALTGALIGLSIADPVLALSLAFLSHFACDMIPHYDLPEADVAARLRSKRFLREFIYLGAALCLFIVVFLAAAHPLHWLLAASCAFMATSPDLLWLPRYLHVRRTGHDVALRHWFYKFHHRIQWRTGPQLWWIETVWFILGSVLVAARV